MIHSGQEFARSKVITSTIPEEDPHKGMIDHNSYEKDNETNYINYKHAQINKELFNYYKGLIELRKKYEAFRRADYRNVKFIDHKSDQFVCEYRLTYKDDEFVVILNANPKISFEVNLPEGKWNVIVNPQKAGTESLGKVSDKLTLEPSTGYVLMKTK